MESLCSTNNQHVGVYLKAVAIIMMDAFCCCSYVKVILQGKKCLVRHCAVWSSAEEYLDADLSERSERSPPHWNNYFIKQNNMLNYTHSDNSTSLDDGALTKTFNNSTTIEKTNCLSVNNNPQIPLYNNIPVELFVKTSHFSQICNCGGHNSFW